jgi:hypothetical protein
MDLGWRKRAIRALKATFCGDFHWEVCCCDL